MHFKRLIFDYESAIGRVRKQQFLECCRCGTIFKTKLLSSTGLSRNVPQAILNVQSLISLRLTMELTNKTLPNTCNLHCIQTICQNACNVILHCFVSLCLSV